MKGFTAPHVSRQLFLRLTASLCLLLDGFDPLHLLLVCGSLDEVMSVRLSDDLKQVPLDFTFHACTCRETHGVI